MKISKEDFMKLDADALIAMGPIEISNCLIRFDSREAKEHVDVQLFPRVSEFTSAFTSAYRERKDVQPLVQQFETMEPMLRIAAWTKLFSIVQTGDLDVPFAKFIHMHLGGGVIRVFGRTD